MNQFADSKSLEAAIPLPHEGDYEADYVLWVEHQAALLRENRLDELDRTHLIGELEAMSGKDRRELRSRLALETGLPHSTFPPENLFSHEEVLELDFIPNASKLLREG